MNKKIIYHVHNDATGGFIADATVIDGGGTYTARFKGKTASCTANPITAVKRAIEKALGIGGAYTIISAS